VRRREDLYREAIAVMARDFASDVTVDAVARTIATSRRQLQRVFDEVGGRSFRTILTQIRMRHAGRLLRESPLPVSAVARQVGYSQPAQFAKTFRSLYGLPPSQYRTSPQPVTAAPIPLGAAVRLGGPLPAEGIGIAAAPAR
jgi:transcriptional regulator GlxA family with amidase domain